MTATTVHFRAKTLTDGGLGLSVHEHCHNLGYVAKMLIGCLPKLVQDLMPPQGCDGHDWNPMPVAIVRNNATTAEHCAGRLRP